MSVTNEVKAHIVIVNDTPFQLRMMRSILEKEGYAVDCFESAEEALAQMTKPSDNVPHLIVTDLHMPGIDGWRFCRLLRSPEYRHLNEVPILINSATFAGEDTKTISDQAGANAFLGSPYKADDLLRFVRELISGGTPFIKSRLLIVEDSKSLANNLGRVLNEVGFDIQVAYDGDSARKMFKAHKPETVILDHHLPDSTGMQLLQEFEVVNPLAVYIMVTGDEEPELAVQAMKLGASAFVRKPCSHDYLIEIIRKAHRENSLLAVERLLEKRTQTLLEQERRHKAAMDAAHEGFCISVDAQLRYVNPAFSQMIGHPIEQVIGTSLFDYVEEGDRAELMEVYRSYQRGDRSIKLQRVRLKTNQNDHCLVEASGSRIYYEGEQALLCVVRDITETHRMRQEMEHSLRENEQRFRLAAESSSDVVYEWNYQTGKLSWFGDLQKLLNIEKLPERIEELSGFIHPEDRERIISTTRAGIANHTRWQEEYRIIDGTGAIRYWYATGKGFYSSSGDMQLVIGSVQDITERKRIEEDLRFKSLVLDQITDHVTVTDLNGIITYVNQAQLELFGKSEEQMIGQSIHSFGEDPNCGATQREIVDQTKQNGHWRGEVVNYSNDGEAHIMDCRTQLVHDKQGRPIALCGIATDITESRKITSALQESESRYRLVAENASDNIWILSLESMCFTYISPSIEKLFGHSIEYAIETPLEGHMTPESYEIIVNALAEELARDNDLTLERDRSRVFELEQYVHDGGTIWTEVTASFVRDDDGNPISVLGITRDISDRKRAQDALSQSEQKFRSIAEQSSDLIALLGQEGQILYASPISTSMFGIEPEDMIGLHYSLFLLDQDIALAAAALEDTILKRQRIKSLELRMKRKDGSSFFGEVNSSPHKTGDQIGSLIMIRDISERKAAEKERERLEQQLMQSLKMEAIGRLAGGVAHDFNNLLTGISGHASLAMMSYSDIPDLMDSLQEISEATNRAAGLTRQLLAFSRKQILEPKVISINRLIEDLLKMLVRLIGEDISFVFTPKRNLPRVLADPGQIEQVVINLCVNARDAMPDGGVLTIETANVELNESYCEHHQYVSPGSYVMLIVSDTGIGMDETTKQRIFEPFFTTKPKDRGTGLGLATIYGIVKQHEGHVEVYSEPGEGTCFRVYLPQTEKLEETPAQKLSAELPGGTESILLVEDETVVRSIAAKMLKRLGYTVLEAASGAEARIISDELTQKIDLLMTDVVMPGENGHELALYILQTRPRVKVLYTSGYTEDTIAHHGVLDKGLQFLGKPFTPKLLAKKIREVLDNGSSLDT